MEGKSRFQTKHYTLDGNTRVAKIKSIVIMKKIEHILKLMIILGIIAGMGALVYGFFSESVILGVLFVTVIISLIWLMVTKDSTEL